MPLNNDAEHILKIKTTLYRYFRCCIRYYVQNDKTETSFNAPMYLMFSDIMILYAIAVFLKLLAASNALLCGNEFFISLILQGVTLINS